MYLGDQAVFIAICSILFAFNIEKAKDEAGNTITPVVDYGGFIRYVVVPVRGLSACVLT